MHYIGIDLGGMSAKCAVLIDGALCGVCRCKTDKNNTPEQTAADLAFLAEEAIVQSGIAKEQTVVKNKSAFPFGTCESALDGSVIVVSEKIDVSKEYEFRFYL